MATRYLIGKGERLTYPIEAPRREPGTKAHPYDLASNQAVLIPQIEAASRSFEALPAAACYEDMAVAKFTLHPAYLAKSYFPRELLRAVELETVGSRTQRVRPRGLAVASAAAEADTTQLLVAGKRAALARFAKLASELEEGSKPAMQFAQIESFSAMDAGDRIRPAASRGATVFEVGLHVPLDASTRRLRAQFDNFASMCEFEVNASFEFEAGRLLFLPVEGERNNLRRLAQFSLMRVVRDMPKLRSSRPMTRAVAVPQGFRMPDAPPLSREPKVAVLDGGLPDDHVLGHHLRRYHESDPDAAPVADYAAHGLGVTSALLFGAIEPGGRAERAYAPVDHHRVLDRLSEEESAYDLYRTLGHVEAVLLSRSYQFINLSLGPELCVEDSDVHAWTAVIDNILSDGETLMTVAVGNNGQGDAIEGLNRIQVPADSVNALSVGAADRSSDGWSKAAYSAIGPGRSPGRRKPDLLAFGGSPRELFHVASPGLQLALAGAQGTSFAAPLALRSAVGIRAILGNEVSPLAIKALLVHGCEMHELEGAAQVGWGKVPADLDRLITCGDGVARIIYQGELRPGKFLRAPVPLPTAAMEGRVELTATFCYASAVDPQDASAYTKAGLGITFRPHVDKRKPDSQNATSATFFPANQWRTEEEQRADLHKWETVLHASKRFLASSLKQSVFDVHYNARDAGAPTSGADRIRYALVLTLRAPRHADLYDQILRSHIDLQALEPVISLPLSSW